MMKVDGEDEMVPMLYFTDNLESVRAIVDARSGDVLKRYDYYPYGLEWGYEQKEKRREYRYKYNGKEDQANLGIDYLDYGARLYDPYIGSWTCTDPEARKFPSSGAYVFCAANPVNYIDPDGSRPIYNKNGELVGVTESGLQGDPFVIEDFEKNTKITDKEAEALDVGVNALSDAAYESFINSYTSLRKRPDWDGYLTLREANKWYRKGNGGDLYVDINKLGLSRMQPLKVGEEKVISLFKKSRKINAMFVFGSITVKGYPNNQIRSYSDTYDFDIKKSKSEDLQSRLEVRNNLTKIGKIIARNGASYTINIYGYKQL